MNVEIDTYGTVYVTLSRRNLRDLLASADGKTICRTTENGVSLFVGVESDREHYQGRQPGPGISADHQE